MPLRTTVKSDQFGEVDFVTRGEYVWVQFGNDDAVQACHGGNLMGDTIMYGGGPANQKGFESLCKKWLREYEKNQAC